MTLAKREPAELGRVTRDGGASESSRRYASKELSESSKGAYASDWRGFEAWCLAEGRSPLPAEPSTVADYMSHLADAGRKASTIARARISIGKVHGAMNLGNPGQDPIVKKVWKGIRRTIGTARTKKAPISPKSLEIAFETMPTTLRGVRDRAVLMLGFAGGFRRSELVGLEHRDVRFCEEGLEVTVRASKTDQEKEGRLVGIPRGRKAGTCPVRLLRKWLDLSGITEGAVFRSVDRRGRIGKAALWDDYVADMVKAAAKAVGLDPKDFSGHSLRAGLVTEAAKAGKATHEIMSQTGHESVQIVHGYIRRTNLFTHNAAKGLY